MKTLSFISLNFLLIIILMTACNFVSHLTESQKSIHKQKMAALSQKSKLIKTEDDLNSALPSNNQSGITLNKEKVLVVAMPDSIPVLVNKQNKLPESYLPKDLIYTNIPFIVPEKTERKKMRRKAAVAIGKLFAAAKEQGVQLLGVSAYRSHSSQKDLFNYYVKIDGFEKARAYSALPGTSEHETGLAIDVTGGNGQCPAQDCFGYTKEAQWLQDHAADYGFIIRYPKGKETVTGYKYEPWHLRFVGRSLAKEIMGRGITLEEYYHSVPVSQKQNTP